MQPKVSLALPVALLLIASLMPTTAAQEEPALTFTGHEFTDCDTAARKLLCWDIQGDTSTAFVAGQEVTIKVAAGGEAPHNLYFIADGKQDKTTYDTKPDGAIAGSETVESGEETTLTFTVPTDVEKLYYWCDLGLPVVHAGGDHELFGMRGTVTVNPAPEEDSVENVTDNGTVTDDNSTSDDPSGADDNSTADNSTTDGADTTAGSAANNTTTEAKDDGPKVRDSPLGGIVGLSAILGLAVILRRRH